MDMKNETGDFYIAMCNTKYGKQSKLLRLCNMECLIYVYIEILKC